MKPVALFIALAGLSLAQQPKLENSKVEAQSAAGNLESTVRGIVGAQSTPAWIAYQVPIIAGQHSMCCSSGCCSGCRLEHTSGEQGSTVTNTSPVMLEGPRSMYVFYRVENKAIGKVRTFTPECSIDAGGTTVYWISDAQPAQSVAFLEAIAAGGDRHLTNGAIAAIAFHADASADRVLDALVAPDKPEETRRTAVFWLGNARGRHGYEVVAKIAHDDPSDRVREHAVFSLSESKEPDAVHAIIEIARNDKSPRVRGQALFWLAHSAQRQVAASAIENAIQNDPETEVKKKAVFALSQLPNGDGVPKLIEVAKNNHNAEVRKQAMFWLGQSKDPRALKFFEDILTR